MSAPAPILFQWDGEAMHPGNGRAAKLCDEVFVVGYRYALIEHEEASDASRRHYFAIIREAWKNLPERIAGEAYAISPEHLRKYALIRCGYAHAFPKVFASVQAAREAAAFIPATHDEFIMATVDGATVTILKARSQKRGPRGMNKGEFQKSKDAVMGFLANLIGVDEPSLIAAGARA